MTIPVTDANEKPKVIDEPSQTLIDGVTALNWTGIITDDSEQKAAAEFLSSVKANAKDLKKKKEAITKPLNASLKEVRELFKPAETQIEDIEQAIKKAMLEYHDKMAAIAQQQIDAIENRVRPGRGNLSLETAMGRLADVDQPETAMQGAQIKYSPEKVRITNALLLVQDHPSLLMSERVLEALRMEVAAEIKAGGRLPKGAELYRDKLVAGLVK